MAVSSKKTFILRHFFNQVILVCVLRILTWQEALTDRSCDISQYTFWLFRQAAIHSLYDILLVSYSEQGNDLFFFDNNKQMIRWNSALIHLTVLFFSGLSAPSPCLFSLLWVCFLLCIYFLFSFFFSVFYVIVNLFPIPNVYSQFVSDTLLFLYYNTSIVYLIFFLSICSLIFVISIYHLSDMGLFPFNL